jgi:hypothetical protein
VIILDQDKLYDPVNTNLLWRLRTNAYSAYKENSEGEHYRNAVSYYDKLGEEERLRWRNTKYFTDHVCGQILGMDTAASTGTIGRFKTLLGNPVLASVAESFVNIKYLRTSFKSHEWLAINTAHLPLFAKAWVNGKIVPIRRLCGENAKDLTQVDVSAIFSCYKETKQASGDRRWEYDAALLKQLFFPRERGDAPKPKGKVTGGVFGKLNLLKTDWLQTTYVWPASPAGSSCQLIASTSH